MILTVTPNPALDVTYEVQRLVPHTSHRVLSVRELAGGKGVNVAAVASLRGQSVVATGLLGGATGGRLRRDLDERRIRHDFAECSHETRRTVTVVSRSDGDATAFNEPGEDWRDEDWRLLVQHLQGLLRRYAPRVLVASGSVPAGFPADGYARLVRLGHDAGCRVVVDASRDALLEAVAAGPDVVKPNREELLGVTGATDPVVGAKLLQDKGAREVVVSLGPDGIVSVAPDGRVCRAIPPGALKGNPTGAGDSAVAAIASGLCSGQPWPEVLADAVAWSGAAVLQPTAGTVDPHDIHRLRAAVRVERE
ncbi:1-phosphofructokinase family hexose kinase [Pedococcus sp. 5OH_020]|uniref:1-phosphofructokinase family hexose kinase n=1 Tax=Pedococcus sp. 5OH_020 TaxID=2989814 RepID=UPI0022E9B259|nr:hexose kinase [Pedococcus sp. 5OH_020]